LVLKGWSGQPTNPATQIGGVRWIEAADWAPYQKKTFVTPAFPGYVSGHSTFSRAAAEVLAAMTGSPFFPGGLGIYRIASLAFEAGPTQPVELQWATYFDAADQAGLSRLWGGIHVSVDDLTGRRLGSYCGQSAWALARQYFDGSILRAPMALSIGRLDTGGCVVRCDTLRGFYYKLQTTSDLLHGFADDPAGFTQAVDSPTLLVDTSPNARKFYRLIRARLD
jgi:hypothetical protein